MDRLDLDRDARGAVALDAPGGIRRRDFAIAESRTGVRYHDRFDIHDDSRAGFVVDDESRGINRSDRDIGRYLFCDDGLDLDRGFERWLVAEDGLGSIERLAPGFGRRSLFPGCMFT
ncbi:hypothetical protein WB350_24855, partial [Escherichia coli]|uniref:hypothetical protein n=1 Tax=Escherichia coli TaxID=562 RepID=UPI002148042A